MSVEFYELYTWLKNSKFYTDDPKEACLRFPTIDFLAYSRVMKNENLIGQYVQDQADWSHGTNNIFFNFLPPIGVNSGMATGFKGLPIGNSLIASSSLRHSTIRFGLDVAIPYYSHAIQHFSYGSTIFNIFERKVLLPAWDCSRA